MHRGVTHPPFRLNHMRRNEASFPTNASQDVFVGLCWHVAGQPNQDRNCKPNCQVRRSGLNCIEKSQNSLAISGVRDGHRNRKSQKSLRLRCPKIQILLLNQQRLLFSFLLCFFSNMCLTRGQLTFLHLLSFSSALPIWPPEASALYPCLLIFPFLLLPLPLPFFRA